MKKIAIFMILGVVLAAMAVFSVSSSEPSTSQPITVLNLATNATSNNTANETANNGNNTTNSTNSTGGAGFTMPNIPYLDQIKDFLLTHPLTVIFGFLTALAFFRFEFKVFFFMLILTLASYLFLDAYVAHYLASMLGGAG